MRVEAAWCCRLRLLCRAVATCWLLFLAGCSPESAIDSMGVETDLHADDGMVQTLQYLFSPATYWQEKCALLRGRVKKDQAAFDERIQAYRVLLAKRREQINLAMSQAEVVGKSADEARRVVIQSYRALLDPVREEAKQVGKMLHHTMALLARAEIATRQQAQQ